MERGDEVEDLTGGDVARKAKLISLRGERGAFVNCKPAKVYCSRCEEQPPVSEARLERICQ